MTTNRKRYVMKGCQNLRDLGGYETRDDLITKWHTCYRCDLPLCDKEGWDVLYEKLGIRTVIDLRSSAEHAQQGYSYVEERIQFLFLPLMKEENTLDVG